ncbi:hypothetical protein RJ492_005327 [Pluralibacter gergoviae]|uniref:Uncharacterized protein n=1 Tax=Pluralibacter gergoviae TaxID=61647 RepID=A0AAI9DR34_PLUGE|nr:hypothetical protein [Pluralibacter gergoviae]EKV9910525.1 hypothetical protein [Pluralibacter gergoviae]EKW7276530.1 hypothetical protein [Pluralibacter gergoviae]ELD4298455.1 hypothetical protein [Pluralibacter gergoviae]ELD4309229.1 hypothetical protein [Pluralibacter gergoviae]
MSYGLLVRNADGSNMFDMGDYSTRFVTQIQMKLAVGQTAAWYGMDINDSEYFASIIKSLDPWSNGILSTDLIAIATNGSVELRTMHGGPAGYERNVLIDIYRFK